jgi:hypothetical protein
MGPTQKELAVLEKQEFDLANGILADYRNKTQVLGTFWLPSELVTLLRAEFARTSEFAARDVHRRRQSDRLV